MGMPPFEAEGREAHRTCGRRPLPLFLSARQVLWLELPLSLEALEADRSRAFVLSRYRECIRSPLVSPVTV